MKYWNQGPAGVRGTFTEVKGHCHGGEGHCHWGERAVSHG